MFCTVVVVFEVVQLVSSRKFAFQFHQTHKSNGNSMIFSTLWLGHFSNRMKFYTKMIKIGRVAWFTLANCCYWHLSVCLFAFVRTIVWSLDLPLVMLMLCFAFGFEWNKMKYVNTNLGGGSAWTSQ